MVKMAKSVIFSSVVKPLVGIWMAFVTLVACQATYVEIPPGSARVFGPGKKARALFWVSGSEIFDHSGRVVATINGNTLLDLKGKELARLEGQKILRANGDLLTELSDGEILGRNGRPIGRVEAVDPVEEALLAAKYVLFAEEQDQTLIIILSAS